MLSSDFAIHYAQLRRIARNRLRHAPDLTLLDTVGLVNEAFLKLGLQAAPEFTNDEHFIAYMSLTMRNLLVDHIRAKSALRRGGNEIFQPLDTALLDQLAVSDEQILDVDGALQELAAVEPRLAQVVNLRFFGGFTEEEIAQVLSLTSRTVKRDWEKAKLMLHAMLAT